MRRMVEMLGVCLLLGLSAAVPAVLQATPPGNTAPPNIVLLLADDMRPDALSVLGHPLVRTPNLDALARAGVLFTRAVAAYPICVISRAEILTGCSAFRCCLPYPGRLNSRLALWPETFRRAGYRTCYSGKWHTDGQPEQRGYEQTSGLYSSGGSKGQLPLPDHAGRPATGYVGWTFKTEDGQVELAKGVGLTPDTDRWIAEGAIKFLRRQTEQPFFLHVNFTGPHDPRLFPRGYERAYDARQVTLPPNFAAEHPFDHGNARGRDELLLAIPRQPEQLRSELAAYYAVISHLDDQIGRIVAALEETGRRENTLVIFTSDQGLAIGSHGLVGKQNLYEHSFGVPLIINGPRFRGGKRLDAACYLRDLFPTTCELAGVAIPETVQGRSLLPLVTGPGATVYPHVIGYFTHTQRAIRDPRWKLIWYPYIDRRQLFDLEQDRDELRDLAADPRYADRVAELQSQLETWLRAHGDPLFTGSGSGASPSRPHPPSKP